MTMTQMQFRFSSYSFKPSWFGFLVVLVCVPTFIKLGLWQYDKARMKQQIQFAYAAAQQQAVPNLPEQIDDVTSWKHKKVKVAGHYETQYQILLDNQVEQSRGGFHVITPLKIDGRNDYILINRGWVAGNPTHAELPQISTATDPVTLTGLVWVPSQKIFSLEQPTSSASWQPVWQHMDMQRYQKSVPITVLPFILKLDPASEGGGFVRHWELPAERIATHIGYAYQWFGFAIASVLIFLYTSIKKPTIDQHTPTST